MLTTARSRLPHSERVADWKGVGQIAAFGLALAEQHEVIEFVADRGLPVEASG